MFEACPKLTSLPAEVTLNKLRSGNRMFLGTKITNVSSFDLKALESGSEMFRGLAINSWSKDMPALKVANNMFYDCNKLYSFTGNLSSLENMDYMFYMAGSTVLVRVEEPAYTILTQLILEKLKQPNMHSIKQDL